jgi:signal transduction histidine kinase
MLLLVASGRASMFERRVSEQNAELRHKTLALSDRNIQLDAVFSLSPDGFVVFAPDGTVRFVNPAFAEMTGIVPAALLGAHEDVLIEELRRRAAVPAKVPAKASEFLGDTATLELARPRRAVLRVLGIDSGAPAVGRILYFHDVTREAEVDRIKSEFLSHAAHELRTPLTIILGYSELLLSAERDAETRAELVDAIHRQAQALVGIINELLDLARIEARRGQDVEIVEVDLAELVRGALADVVLPDARWTLALDLPEGALQARVDAAKFRQALMNLLSNAIKYSSEGGETRVEVVRAGARLGVRVRDQGIGMSAGQLARYGERFWRADTSGRVAGTGLGVSIVKEILALMGGSLEVESRPGHGTTATLWVRAADA